MKGFFNYIQFAVGSLAARSLAALPHAQVGLLNLLVLESASALRPKASAKAKSYAPSHPPKFSNSKKANVELKIKIKPKKKEYHTILKTGVVNQKDKA